MNQKIIIFSSLLFPFSLSSMQAPKMQSSALPCYLAACPIDVCNIIAEMLHRQPNSITHRGVELKSNSSNIVKINQYGHPIDSPPIANDFNYKKGNLTFNTVIADALKIGSLAIKNPTITIKALNNKTNKSLRVISGKYHDDTVKLLTVSPNNSKILWVEERYNENEDVFIDEILIYDLVIKKCLHEKLLGKRKSKMPLVGMAIANTGDIIARLQQSDENKYSVIIEKLAEKKSDMVELENAAAVYDISFDQQTTKLIFFRTNKEKGWVDTPAIDLPFSPQELKKRNLSQNKLLNFFRYYGVCKNLQSNK